MILEAYPFFLSSSQATIGGPRLELELVDSSEGTVYSPAFDFTEFWFVKKWF